MTENGGTTKRSPVGRSLIETENKTRIQRPMLCKVLLLNGEECEVTVDKRAVGQVLFENVCDYLDLLERDYFGLLFTEDSDPEHIKYWLDLNKKITKQKKNGRMNFEFALKFYPPDPTQLTESITRYLVCLQIRRDIISGKLPCSQATQAMLGSYAVQADIGDYDPIDHGTGVDYIRDMPFSPEQTEDLLYKIAALHKQHKGQTPEQAELHYLEYSKKIPLYGIDLHRAKDSDYVDIMIGVGATGISVFRDNLRINRFVWPKILKISYRRNKFLLRIRPAEFETYESWIAFRLPNNKMAKRLWKIAVEHHAFLRLRSAEDAKKRTGLPRFGSKYRYSGRTLYQTRLNASMADRPSKQFERTHSRQSLNSIVNSRFKSQDDLNLHQKSYQSQRIMNLHNLSLDIKKPENNRGTVADITRDRTPLQSPLPQQDSSSPTYREVIRHEASNEDTDLDGRLPQVPQELPGNERRPLSKHQNLGGVQPLKRQESLSESDRSSRSSMRSVDLRKDDMKSPPKVAAKPGKDKPPPVAKKPENLSKIQKPSVAEKPQKAEKSEKTAKAPKSLRKEKVAAKEVFM